MCLPAPKMYCLQQQQTSFTTAGGRAQSRGLPVRIGHAASSLMTMMTELQSLLRVVDQCDTWEMFCAPESWLTQACEAHGLKAHRINLACSYNLYDPKSYQQLRERFHHERPRRIWVSARCTCWCPWTALNYQTEERREQLEKYRRRERAMFKLLIPFLLEMLQLYPETGLFWEWPTRCSGWQEPWL